MPRKYTNEQIEYLKEIAPGRYADEIANLFNARYGMNLTEKMVKSLKKNYGIKSGVKPGFRVPPNKLFTDEISRFIRKHYEGIGNQELAELVNEKFGTKFTRQQLMSFKANNKLSSGLTGQFQKGHVPQNKGKRQTDYMSPDVIERTKATWFQKGQPSINYLPVGSERVDNKNGYLLVKVSDEGTWNQRWRQKHRVVWEERFGPIPKGKVLIFLDQDKTNCTIENLRLATKADVARLNQNHLLTDVPEANEVAINIARVMTAVGKKRK